MARTKKESLPPPGNRPHNYDWSAIAAARMTEPLQWKKVVAGCLYSTALSVKTGQNSTFRREKGFEVTTRGNSPDRRAGVRRTCDLWIRYRPDWDQRLSPEDRARQMDEARKEQDAEDQRVG